ncbi:hypothetical protein DPMN_135888 [Dreissena polymorpha]|uniref:Uncharacterized protein n=1 Tax=Dreissena polymorpha TaxID=45954 RepID=A0A9D4JG70_DREPO|nr:hypothetical protein DPMN_135888 [Dreissena polymorpha]
MTGAGLSLDQLTIYCTLDQQTINCGGFRRESISFRRIPEIVDVSRLVQCYTDGPEDCYCQEDNVMISETSGQHWGSI